VARYRLGCTGWGYDDWRGGFYPPGTPASEYLERYARVFGFTEVDSTYYRVPAREQVARWATATPPGFLFSAKFPGDVTHKASLRGAESTVDAFLVALAPLKAAGKLGPLVLQFPASFKREPNADALDAFLAALPADVQVAVELRHPSWFVPATYAMLESRRASLVWGVHEGGRAPPVLTSDALYARLIGDRALTRFDKVQRDLTPEVRYWRDRFEDEGRSARIAYVIVNNHFMGFAPETVDLVARELGLARPDLGAARRDGGQRSLRDLFG